MKDATNISSDMKNLLTLGNSVSWEMFVRGYKVMMEGWSFLH